MQWTVSLADEFEADFLALREPVQDGVLAMAKLLQSFGPHWDDPMPTR